jgi:hypothetical protein
MRWLIPLLVLAVWPVRSAPATLVTPLLLYTDFEIKPPGAVEIAIQNEVESIMSPIGWHFVWESLPTTERPKICIRLVVVRFKGVCDAQDMAKYPPYPYSLGATEVTDGQILPFANIYCTAIRALLAPDLVATRATERNTLFARAVGRVLAHELYHVFANEKHHAGKGVAEAHFSSEELLSDSLRFEPKQVRKLRSNLTPILHQVFDAKGSSDWRKGPAVFIESGCSGCHGSSGEGTQWGPTLRGLPRASNLSALVSRLTNSRSEMYKRAEELQVPWPRLTNAKVEQLAAYVNSLSE